MKDLNAKLSEWEKVCFMENMCNDKAAQPKKLPPPPKPAASRKKTEDSCSLSKTTELQESESQKPLLPDLQLNKISNHTEHLEASSSSHTEKTTEKPTETTNNPTTPRGTSNRIPAWALKAWVPYSSVNRLYLYLTRQS